MVIEARSEPIPGSVIATAVISSPEQIPGSQRCFCSSLVWWRKYGTQMSLCRVRPSPIAFAPACWISSAITAW